MGARKSTQEDHCVPWAGGPSGRRGWNGKETDTRRHSVLSLFSGGGGLDLGLHLTERYHHLACIEWDEAACRTLEANRDAGLLGENDTKVVEADIANLHPAKLLAEMNVKPGEVNLLIGGPPCQAFSVAGKKLGLADSRGKLLWDYVRWVKAVRPSCFLMENVRGLLTMPLAPDKPKGSLLAELLRKVKRVGYTVDTFEVDAADYGVAQHRKRVIPIGNRHGFKARPPIRTHGRGLIPYRTLRDALAGLVEPDPVRLDFSPGEKAVLRLVPAGGDWRDLPVRVAMEVLGSDCRPRGKGRCRGYHRLAWDRPSPTVLTGPNRGLAALCHPDEDRALTLRECARIQGWPDRWVFCGSKTEQYRQVGNGVPVQLAYVLGHVVADLLDGITLERDGNLRHRVPARRPRRTSQIA